jgi:hypothetical protein
MSEIKPKKREKLRVAPELSGFADIFRIVFIDEDCHKIRSNPHVIHQRLCKFLNNFSFLVSRQALFDFQDNNRHGIPSSNNREYKYLGSLRDALRAGGPVAKHWYLDPNPESDTLKKPQRPEPHPALILTFQIRLNMTSIIPVDKPP